MDDDIAYYEQLAEEEFVHQAELEAIKELELEAENVSKSKVVESIDNELHIDEDLPPFENEENIPPIASKTSDTIISIDESEDTVGQKRKSNVDLTVLNPSKRSRLLPKKTVVLRVPPAECDSVKLINALGDIRYLRMKSSHSNPTFQTQKFNMTETPLRELRELAYTEKREAENRRNIEIESQKKKKQSDARIDWISKYRAKSYTELLSDETTNRSILKWLKAWQQCVFKIKKKTKKKPKIHESFGRKFGGNDMTNGKERKIWKSFGQRLEEKAEEEAEADELGQ